MTTQLTIKGKQYSVNQKLIINGLGGKLWTIAAFGIYKMQIICGNEIAFVDYASI